MALHLSHSPSEAITVSWDNQPLFRYVYTPDDAPASEFHRPHLHPIRTLAGDVITLDRPHDHPWHRGLSLTLTSVNGENFWGGPTYVTSAQAYKPLDNVGQTKHIAWTSIDPDHLQHTLHWITAGGETWLHESRTLHIERVDPYIGAWSMWLRFHLTNVSHLPLEIGTPTTAGRPNAGYGGLFWRGPRSFHGGTVLTETTDYAEAGMGTRSAWLAYIGQHDTSLRHSTLIFQDTMGNPRYPTQWFVRNIHYAGASGAFMFDKLYTLPAGSSLMLMYRMVVANGAYTRSKVINALQLFNSAALPQSRQ
jgi:hypothetical protein